MSFLWRLVKESAQTETSHSSVWPIRERMLTKGEPLGFDPLSKDVIPLWAGTQRGFKMKAWNGNERFHSKLQRFKYSSNQEMTEKTFPGSFCSTRVAS